MIGITGAVTRRAVLVLWAALAVLVGALLLDTALGDYPLPAHTVLDVLTGGGTRGQRFVVLELRLPRALTGALVGAALAVSGAITQALARNPLASPDVLGVTSGAGAGAVAVIVLAGSYGVVGGAAGAVGIPLAALAGGLLAGLAVHLLSWRGGTAGGGLDGYRMVLVGIGVATVLANLTFWLLTLGEVSDTGRAMTWITGSLAGRGWQHVLPVAVALAVLLPAALLGARHLDLLQFGDDTALGLGLRLHRTRAGYLLAAVLLAAVATAAAGPVAFVALATPQIALRLVRTARPPLLASAVLGAALTVAADLLARTAFGSVELPVGVITAALGAPYLVHLLIRARRTRA